MILLMAGALFAAACNPGMFIEPLNVSGSESDVPFTGGTVEVEVSHGDWEIERVAVDHIDCGLDVDSEGVMKHESDFLTFEVARPERSRLVLTVEDASKSSPQEMEIYLSDDFQSEVIYVHIGACVGYSFDRIEYGKPVLVSGEDAFELGWENVCVNLEDKPVIEVLEVFREGLFRMVSFPAATVSSVDLPYAMWYDSLMEYLTGPFEVPLPDPVLTDGNLTFSDALHMPFTYDKVRIPFEDREAVAIAGLEPGSNNVRMYWGYVEYKVPYTIWFTHPDGGRQRCFTGEFTSRAYDGRWMVEVK